MDLDHIIRDSTTQVANRAVIDQIRKETKETKETGKDEARVLVSSKVTPEAPMFIPRDHEETPKRGDIKVTGPRRRITVEDDEEVKNMRLYMALRSSMTKRTIVVDSRDRDTDLYPSPDHYTIRIGPVPMVYRVVMSYSLIPDGRYLIEPDQLLTWEDAGVTTTAVIPPGDYETPALVAAVQVAMNSTGASNYTVSLVNSRVRIISDLSGGTLKIKSRGIGIILGFMSDTSPGAIHNAGTEPDKDTAAIEIDIPELESADMDIFALAHPGRDRNLRDVYYRAPRRLNKLTVSIPGRFDHSFILELYTTS